MQFAALVLEFLNSIRPADPAVEGSAMDEPREGWGREYYSAFAEIRMFGSDEIVEAALEVNDLMNQAVRAANQGAVAELVQSARNVAQAELRHFAEIARVDLGVTENE